MDEKHELPFYSAHAKELEGSVDAKIKAILEQGALEYDKENKRYICKPIMQKNGKPYNSTTYELKKEGDMTACTCQGYRSKLRKWQADPINARTPTCSHVAALHELWARQHKERREQKAMQGLLCIFL